MFLFVENRSPSKNQDGEKEMLQNLNKRLSCYIERLRELEKENEDIKKQVNSVIFFLGHSFYAFFICIWFYRILMCSFHSKLKKDARHD